MSGNFSFALGLSTVRQPVVEAGEAGAQLLLDLLGGGTAGEVMLDHELILRATTHC